MYITITEFHKGLSRSSKYHFILEEDKLVHISRYAISKRTYEDMAEYIVDINRIRHKKVIEIMASNSGILCSAYTYPAEDLQLKYDQRRAERQPLFYLNGLDFEHLTAEEKLFLRTDWRQYYIPMLEELRKVFTTLKTLESSYPFITLPRLLACQIESNADYPLSFLIPYSEKARRRSLEGLTKEIHQLWVAMRIIAELARLSKLSDLYLNFEQSSYHAIASFQCGNGSCSLWYEFDMNPHTMCRGLLWYQRASIALREFYERVSLVQSRRRLRRLPLRPDLAIIEGGNSCDKLLEGFRVKTIIECKNWDYTYWSKDVENQIIPYHEIFQPETTIIASLKKIPDQVKNKLAKHRITVIDEVYPRGRGEQQLLQLIRDTILS